MNSVLDEVVADFEPSPELVSVMLGSSSAVLLALDIGTSGVRAALFDGTGGEIHSASLRRPHLSQGGAATNLDADEIFDLVVETLDSLFASYQATNTQIEFVAISCFWHSLLGIDSDGRPTTPVLTWADTSAAQASYKLRYSYDEAEFHWRTGCRFHPSYWPAKLLWLKAEQSAVFDRTRKWVSFGEYLGLRLFDTTVTSVSMASGTGLFDQRKCDWDAELLRELGIALDTVPEIAAETITHNRLDDRGAKRWPLLQHAVLCPAIGDGAANSIGSACVTPERVALMVGTSGAMRTLYEAEPPDRIPFDLWCYRADRKRIVVGGALSDGGGLYAWMRGSLAFLEDDEELENELQNMEPDAHGLTLLPFWTGERSTGWSPDAKGAVLGLTLHTRPIEIMRAAMEAVAYRFALIAKALDSCAPDAAIIASGNALHSSQAWTQILTDVLGKPVTLSNLGEASTRGAALLALEAAGRIENIEHFEIPIQRVHQPDMSRHARYKVALERQQKYEVIAKNVSS